MILSLIFAGVAAVSAVVYTVTDSWSIMTNSTVIGFASVVTSVASAITALNPAVGLVVTGVLSVAAIGGIIYYTTKEKNIYKDAYWNGVFSSRPYDLNDIKA